MSDCKISSISFYYITRNLLNYLIARESVFFLLLKIEISIQKNYLRIKISNSQADVLVDIECDSKHLDHVVRMLKREVQSVNFASTVIGDSDFPPPTPLSQTGSFGKMDKI